MRKHDFARQNWIENEIRRGQSLDKVAAEAGITEGAIHRRMHSRGITVAALRMEEPRFSIVAKEDAAWAAGFLDGEGYFGITSKLAPVVQASQVATDAPLRKLQELFGGGIRSQGYLRNFSWSWKLGRAEDVRRMISVVSPFMHVKYAEAQLVLAAAMTLQPHGRRDALIVGLRETQRKQLLQLRSR